jgi:hypothetical protein
MTGVAVGLSMHMLTADAAPNPDAAANQRAGAHAAEMHDAAIGRRAVANRYGSCAISQVVDHHVAIAPEGVLTFGDDKLRDRIDVTVQVTETPQALQQEVKYNKDDAVVWFPVQYMARERVTQLNGSTQLGTTIPGPEVVGSSGHNISVTQPLYPYADRQSGNIALYLGEEVETNDLEGRHDYRDYGAIYCGTIALKGDGQGNLTWQADPSATALPNIYRTEDCPLIEDPLQPGAFYEQC